MLYETYYKESDDEAEKTFSPILINGMHKVEPIAQAINPFNNTDCLLLVFSAVNLITASLDANMEIGTNKLIVVDIISISPYSAVVKKNVKTGTSKY